MSSSHCPRWSWCWCWCWWWCCWWCWWLHWWWWWWSSKSKYQSAPGCLQHVPCPSQQIWIPSIVEQIWISIAETRLDFHPGAKLDFHHESNLDFIAEKYWIFNMKCVMYLCQIVKQMHARSSHMPRSHCAKCFCKMSTDIAVHARNPVCPADTRKYGFWTRHLCKLHQSLVSSVASQGGQDLWRKSLRFLSQSLSDFWKISLKFCHSWILEFL